MPRRLQEEIARAVAEMKVGQAASGNVPDPDLVDPVILGGGQMDENQEAIEKLEAEAEERELNSASSKTEREQAEKIKDLEAQLVQARRRWEFADYSDLPVNFPFEITIQPLATAGGNLAAEPNLNGHVYRIPRGVPTNVPKALLEILDGSKYEKWEPLLDPATGAAMAGESNQGVKWYKVEHHRYPYAARPLYHRADELTKWPGIFPEIPANHLGEWKDIPDRQIEAHAKAERDAR